MVPTPAILAVGQRVLPPTLPLEKRNVQRPTIPWTHDVVSIAGDAPWESVRVACQALARQRGDRIVMSGRLAHSSDVATAHAEALDDLTVLRSMAAPPDAYSSSQLLVPRVVAKLPARTRHVLAKRFEGESDHALHLLWVFLMRNRHAATVARALNVHQNTLRYHLDRLERRTGLNLNETRSIIEATLALFALRMLNPSRFSHELSLFAPWRDGS